MAYSYYEPTPKPKAEAPTHILRTVDSCGSVDAAIGKIAVQRGTRESDLLFFEDVPPNSGSSTHYNASVPGAGPERSGWSGTGTELKPTWSGAKRPHEGDDILFWDSGATEWIRLNSVTKEWLRARKQEDDPHSPANGGFYWTLYGAGGSVTNPPTDTKDFRTRLQAAFRRECTRAGWCGSANAYLARAGITAEERVRITVEVETNDRTPAEIERRLRSGYGLNNPRHMKVESLDEDHPFDKLELTEAIGKVHAQARQAIRDYSSSKHAIVRMLREAGAPLPGPRQITLAVTITGRTELGEAEVVEMVRGGLTRNFTNLTVTKVEAETDG